MANTSTSRALNHIRKRTFESLPDNGLTLQARGMAGYIGRLASSMESLELIAARRDPTITDAAHAKRVSDMAKKLEKFAAEAEQAIHEQNRTGSEHLTTAIHRRTNLTPGSDAGEIRSVVRGLSKDERHEVLSTALKNDDRSVLAALLGSNPLLTGLEPDRVAKVRESFEAKHAPEEFEAMNQLHATYSTAIGAIGTVRKAAKQFSDPVQIADINRESAAADDALASFNEATAQ